MGIPPRFARSGHVPGAFAPGTIYANPDATTLKLQAELQAFIGDADYTALSSPAEFEVFLQRSTALAEEFYKQGIRNPQMIQDMVIRNLSREFGEFLARDPHNHQYIYAVSVQTVSVVLSNYACKIEFSDRKFKP